MFFHDLQRTIGNRSTQKVISNLAVQRRVTFNVENQTITPASTTSLTDAEHREQVTRCQELLLREGPGSSDPAVIRENLAVLEAEVKARSGERYALGTGDIQALVDVCQGQVTLYTAALINVKTNTANAGRRALRNIAELSNNTDPTSVVAIIDLFSIVLKAFPFASLIIVLHKNDKWIIFTGDLNQFSDQFVGSRISS